MILVISILVLDRLNGVESDAFCLLVPGVFDVLVVLLFCYAISSALTCRLRVPHRGVFPYWRTLTLKNTKFSYSLDTLLMETGNSSLVE